jgi:hypothetical protein
VEAPIAQAAIPPVGDIVLFEIPFRDDATDLFHGLDPDRTAWAHELGEVWLVGTELRGADDLAVLLREVERWVADRHLGAIRFWVDEKDYVMHAGEIAWSALAL